jgi:hypothetical protein
MEAPRRQVASEQGTRHEIEKTTCTVDCEHEQKVAASGVVPRAAPVPRGSNPGIPHPLFRVQTWCWSPGLRARDAGFRV